MSLQRWFFFLRIHSASATTLGDQFNLIGGCLHFQSSFNRPVRWCVNTKIIEECEFIDTHSYGRPSFWYTWIRRLVTFNQSPGRKFGLFLGVGQIRRFSLAVAVNFDYCLQHVTDVLSCPAAKNTPVSHFMLWNLWSGCVGFVSPFVWDNLHCYQEAGRVVNMTPERTSCVYNIHALSAHRSPALLCLFAFRQLDASR